MSPEDSAKEQAARRPTRDDLHEQREADQVREGVVQEPRDPPAGEDVGDDEDEEEELEAERADWEGMGQPQSSSAAPPSDSSAQR